MTDSANIASAQGSKGERRAGVSFFQLREGRCKFPLGGIEEPPERFCGAVTPIGDPYCASCQAKAYSRLERRK
ncbi:GcrA family cell cycle regulator [Methylocystis sp. IM2]|jgi:hypothetical protein|uniref:GcrA family cell cycle regulator n=1 Tax=unclassified Methylocystis TaxID=2625913 RepID=UPI00404786CB